jgi:hypothetical protein
MAFTPYHNITGSTSITTELIKPGSGASGIKSIMITNTHSTSEATVTLFLQFNPTSTAPSTFNILSTASIPAHVSLLLDNVPLLSFNNSKYGLYLTVGSSDTLDVLIND